ncbi:MAG: hypothetical protein SOZ48_07065 [Eubacterium sp.]|nr:hypothetical protein [Eubacterium sp.]
MNNFYGIGYTGSSFFDTYFGTSNNTNSSNSSSWISGLGDLKMIQSGVYKKALKAYYKTQTANSDEETISGSGQADSNNNLSLVKAASAKLNKAASNLQNKDYSTVKAEDLVDDVKDFVSSYNSTLSGTKNLNSYSILQTAVWTTEQMNISEGLLNKVGISIKEDNSLSLDEEKFKSAKSSDLKALFSGSGSLMSQIAQKASTMANQSANQLAVNSGKMLYNRFGTLN